MFSAFWLASMSQDGTTSAAAHVSLLSRYSINCNLFIDRLSTFFPLSKHLVYRLCTREGYARENVVYSQYISGHIDTILAKWEWCKSTTYVNDRSCVRERQIVKDISYMLIMLDGLYAKTLQRVLLIAFTWSPFNLDYVLLAACETNTGKILGGQPGRETAFTHHSSNYK